MKSIKAIRQQFKEQGVFYTCQAQIDLIKSFVDIDYKNIYDPTVGQGNLLTIAPDDVAKFGQDIDAAEVAKCGERLKNFNGYVGDVLTDPAFTDFKFDLIVANPPFSIKYDRDKVKDDPRFKGVPLPSNQRADFAFLFHIISMLSDNGLAVTINYPGILYRGNSEFQCRKYLCDLGVIETIQRIPAKQFEDTDIETALITFRKNKTNKDITFINGEQKRLVPFDEIVKTNYDLGFNTYLESENKKDEIEDIAAFNIQVQEEFFKRTKAALEWEFAICEHCGADKNKLLDLLDRLLEVIVNLKSTMLNIR